MDAYILNSEAMKSLNIVICTIARKENLYIREWVDYHLSIGFSHIYIFDNNREGEERVSEVLGEYYGGLVTIVPLHNMDYPQMWVYEEFYKNYDFDWVAFIDIDEFITFCKAFKSISGFISSIPEDFDAVYLNWMCFGDNGNLDITDKGVLERFDTPLPYGYAVYNLFGKNPLNNTVKTIVRNGADYVPATPHTGTGTFRVCNSLFMEINRDNPFQSHTFENCYIRHYISKTIGEYISQKLRRGVVDGPNTKYSTWMFFKFNRVTISKLRYRAKLLKQYGIQETFPNFKWWVRHFVEWYVILPLFSNTKMFRK